MARKLAPTLLPLLAYMALAAAFYAPILLGLRWFPAGDFTDHFLPFSLFQRSEALAGRLPVWNPYTFSGHPFLADTQAAVFYPLSNLLLALTAPWGGVMARLYWLQVEAVLHVALAGFFTYLLARDLTGRRLPAFLAGGLFAFSGFLTGYPPLQLAILRAAIWLPLILWCIRRAFVSGRPWRWWIAAAVAYAVSFLAGHPQTFLYVSYCVAGWALLHLLRAPRPRGPRVGQIAAFYALFLALSAAQLLPSVEFTLLSVRANVDYAFVSGGFTPHDLWQMLAAGVVSQYSPLFVGLIGLGLAFGGLAWALWAVVRPRIGADRSSAARALYFGAVALVGLLASFGGNGFLYPALYRVAPGWSLFRGQERSAYLVAFGLSLLAAYGLAALARLSRSRRRNAVLAWGIACAAGLALTWFALSPAADAAGQLALRRGLLAGALAVGLVAALSEVRPDARRAMRLLVIVALAELFVANIATNLAARPALPWPEALAVQSAAASTAAGGSPSRSQNEGRLPEDYGMLVGVEDISGSSPLRLARYDGFLHDFPLPRLWQLTGVGTVLASRPDLYAPTAIVSQSDSGASTGYVHRVDPPQPRAWLASSVISVGDDAALAFLSDERVDLGQTAVLPPPVHGQGRPLGLEDGWLANTGGSQVRLEQVQPGFVRVNVSSAGGGYLVVSENWMPGWEATVIRGGERVPATALRTNLSFLGVPIAGGDLTVELRYRPLSVRLGLLISGLTILALLVVWPAPRRVFRSAARVFPRRALLSDRLAMLLIALLGFGLRVFHLGYAELRGDEALGRLFSLEPIGNLIRSTIALKEPHPVASYVIQGAWFGLAGHSEFALRFVSAWFGALAAPLVYALARRLGLARLTAVLAALFMAISPYAIWHSQDARMYSMSLALTLASTALIVAALARGKRWAWVGYVAVTWLALQTHYYAAYIVIVQNLFVFGRAAVSPVERRRVLPWLAAQAVTGLLYLPWLIAARSTLTGYVGNGDSPGFVAMWLRSLSVFAVGETMPVGQRTLAAYLAAALALLGAVRLARAGATGRRALWLAGLYLIVPLLITWAGALSRPIFNERYIIAALPGFVLLAAAAVTPQRTAQAKRGAQFAGWANAAGVALAALLVAGMGLSFYRMAFDPAFSKSSGWRQLAAVMARFTAAAEPGATRVAQNFPDPTLWYYYTGPEDHTVIPPAGNDQAAADALVADLVAQGVGRVVLAAAPSGNWDNNEIAARALQSSYALSTEVPVGNWKVQVYDRAPAALAPKRAQFATGLALTAAALSQQRLTPGDALTAYLRWQAPASALSGSEKITLQLLDAEGKVAAQMDRAFGAADLDEGGASYVILLPRTLRDGPYRLIAALYDPAQPGAPRLLTTDGADFVELAVLDAASAGEFPFK